MQFCYLSHPLKLSLPVYGGMAEVSLSMTKSLLKGDSCNVYRMTFENHWGTHVDCPAHFFSNGKGPADYPPEWWIFKRPQVISIELQPAQIITVTDIISKIEPDADMLIFHSGWTAYRETDDIYSTQNPGIHPDVGRWLRGNYPSVRTVGMDWVSLSSYKHRAIGREAHKAFLNPDAEGHPILIVEDMNLKVNLTNLKEVWVMPLLVEAIDSAPCTVIGTFDE